MHILLIEDNIKTATYLCKGLKEHACKAEAAVDGQEGLFLATQNTYDVIVLDIMLPSLDGWSIIKTLRDKQIFTPILILTACDKVEQRVKGLELGADDYLIKPFAFSELLARIRSLARRKAPPAPSIIQIGDLQIDILKHQAIRGKTKLKLTAKEFMLLLFLAKRKGEILSRTLIAEQVWDINFDSDTNAIDVAIKRLRDKIDANFEKKLIQNVRGVGYVLED